MTVPGTPEPPASGTRSSSSMPSSDESPLGVRAQATALYRFLQEDGQLLYVGIISRLRYRLREHSRVYATTWWPKVDSTHVDWYPTRAEAACAEREAIATESPLYNVQHTPQDRVRRGKRPGRSAAPEGRGQELRSLLKARFGGRPFTSAEAVAAALANQSKATVERELRSLLDRGYLIVAGARHIVADGSPRRDRTLYALPVHEWIDGKTNSPLADPPASAPPLRKKAAATDTPRQAPLICPPRTPSDSDVPDASLPPAVTFQSGAEILMRLGIVAHITHQGIRHISKSEEWPFGEGRACPYWTIGNATVMETGPFLEYFRLHPTAGRGPDAPHCQPVIPRTAEVAA